MGLSIANNAMPTGATKSMKRAATGSAATNAEKRKKALKRL
jgi:ubiquitin-conjugating enzyme E2 S